MARLSPCSVPFHKRGMRGLAGSEDPVYVHPSPPGQSPRFPETPCGRTSTCLHWLWPALLRARRHIPVWPRMPPFPRRHKGPPGMEPNLGLLKI